MEVLILSGTFLVLEIRLRPIIKVVTDGGIKFYYFKSFSKWLFLEFNIDKNRFLHFHALWSFGRWSLEEVFLFCEISSVLSVYSLCKWI